MPVLSVALAPVPETIAPSPSILGAQPLRLTSKSEKNQQFPWRNPFTSVSRRPERELKLSAVFADKDWPTKTRTGVSKKENKFLFIFLIFNSGKNFSSRR